MTVSQRFMDNGNGSISDQELNLIWKKTDSFQDLKKWVNWFDKNSKKAIKKWQKKHRYKQNGKQS